jgi:hypothetical protein
LKNILVLGDSFSYGQGCADRETTESLITVPSMYSWPSLLAKDLIKFDSRIDNISKPGNSIMGMLSDLLEYKESIDMLIVTITSFDRLLVADPINPDNFKNWVIGYLPPKNESKFTAYNKSKEMYRKYLINDKIAHINTIAYMSAFFNYATKQKIKCLYSVPKIYNYKLSSIQSDGIAFEHMYDYAKSTTFGYNKICTVPDGHPNALGHLTYYERVIKHNVLPYIKENL